MKMTDYTQEPENTVYGTNDMYEAAVLYAEGLKYLGAQRERFSSKSLTFEFADDGRAEDIIRDLTSGELTGNIKRLIESIRTMKSVVAKSR